MNPIATHASLVIDVPRFPRVLRAAAFAAAFAPRHPQLRSTKHTALNPPRIRARHSVESPSAPLTRP